MTLTNADLAHILVALILLLSAAHLGGWLFQRLRQPPVIGEILGGLLLGPTLLGVLAPTLQAELFPPSGPTAPVLGAVYQIGLLLLMFLTGGEIRSHLPTGERRTAVVITVTGVLIPFVLGLAVVRFVDVGQHLGAAGNVPAFTLVFAIAMAVTSIPIISRIMLDLGILHSKFARIVLAAAVLEDILLYVALAIALGLAEAGRSEMFGLPAIIGLDGTGPSMAYHVVASLLFFAVSLTLGRPVLARLLRLGRVLPGEPGRIALQLTFMMALAGVCLFLDVAPIFGAFVAGIVSAGERGGDPSPWQTMRRFSVSFFVPVYFAVVGLRLDLAHHFDPLFFLLMLTFACAVKGFSVYLGARLAGESPSGARNLAVAMNARGGPGIVLATVAYDADLIDEGFFATLVMLAIVTSLLAGSWLGRVVREGGSLMGLARTPILTAQVEVGVGDHGGGRHTRRDADERPASSPASSGRGP